MTDKEVMQMALDSFQAIMFEHDEDIGMDDYHDDDSVGWYGNGTEMLMTFGTLRRARKAIEALRAALAQPEPEPVAWADKHDVEREGHDFWVSRQQPAKDGVPLYTAPREWVGLTDEEALTIGVATGMDRIAIRMIEAKLKEKNK